MSFPTSPIDGQQYTNALGTVYQYKASDIAWKIVGSSTTGFILGSGTTNVIPRWTDTTTLGDSILSQATNEMTLDSSVSPGGGLKTVLRIRLDSTGEGDVAGTGSAMEFALHDASYNGFMSSLAGIRSDSDNVNSGMARLSIRDYKAMEYGPSFISQEWLPHIGGRASSTIYSDATVSGKLRVTDNAAIGDSASSIGVLNVNKAISSPFGGAILTNVGSTSDANFTRDPTYGMVTLSDAGTLASDSTLNILTSDQTSMIFTGLLYVDANSTVGGNINGGGALLNVGTDVCGIVVNVIDQWGSFVTPSDSTQDCINFDMVAPGTGINQKLSIINRYAYPAMVRYWFTGGKNGLI